MKNKFNALMLYFRSAGLEEIPFTIELDTYTINEIDFDINITTSGVIDEIFLEITQMFIKDAIDDALFNVYSDTFDQYKIFGHIITKEKVIQFDDFEYMVHDTEESGGVYHIDEYDNDELQYKLIEETNEILKKLNLTQIIIRYNGSGDDGYISNEYESDKGNGEVPEELKDICYKLLEEYGGWEINEGSSGMFVFSHDTIQHDHSWNVYENEMVGIDIKIDEKTFND